MLYGNELLTNKFELKSFSIQLKVYINFTYETLLNYSTGWPVYIGEFGYELSFGP
jgi:hypothetical protein